MFKSFLCSFLILLCSVIVETSILSNISFLPAVPDLALICVLYFSFLNGKNYGQVSGFLSGLLLDFLSGSPLGFNCLYRTVIGYLSGVFRRTINASGFLVPSVIGLLATILKVFLIWLISLFFKSIKIYNIFTFSFLFELVMNVLLTPLMFKFLNSFRRILNIHEEEL
ncbi:MAG: rod shape-determining protein MreD [Treponema sp.]|nr:rod shape-determining protein MreD [Spirochaetia bacterium]MDD5776210.1 rod shape-determining protein MreD [Treponema sp.]MDD6655406.1 rod shape-determining protein MreD [Treponema sp.]